MAENLRSHEHRSTAAEPSLLAGLAFDDQGVRLQPSHSTKGARRYRYYFRRANAAGRDEGRSERGRRALRIPAPELEAAVLGGLTGFLRDERRLLEHLGGLDAGLVRQRLRTAAGLADRLESAPMASKIEVLQGLVVRITVAPACLEITLRTAMVWDSTTKTSNDDATASIGVPVRLKRCGLAVRLIVRGPNEHRARGPNPGLIALLAKAQRWFGLLKSGQSPSVLAIAQEHGMATKEVTRVIYLAFLAPDIVQRIVRGEQPMGMGTKQLLAMAPLPLDWNEQRKLLGFEH